MSIEIACAAVGYFNGYPGSVPAEDVRRVLRQQHPGLYNVVVGETHRGDWDAFIDDHREALVPEEHRLRLRLSPNTGWRAVDAGLAAWAAPARRRLRERLVFQLRSQPGHAAPLRVLCDSANHDAAAQPLWGAGRFTVHDLARDVLAGDPRFMIVGPMVHLVAPSPVGCAGTPPAPPDTPQVAPVRDTCLPCRRLDDGCCR